MQQTRTFTADSEEIAWAIAMEYAESISMGTIVLEQMRATRINGFWRRYFTFKFRKNAGGLQ